MSADNGIYILKTPKDNNEGFEYRVIHSQAIENIYWDDVNGYDYDDPNPVILLDYFCLRSPGSCLRIPTNNS